MPKHAPRIGGQSIVITPKSCRRPSMCGLLFQHFMAPQRFAGRHRGPFNRHPKLPLYLIAGYMALHNFQVTTLFRNEQGTAYCHTEKGKHKRECGFHGFLHHVVMELEPLACILLLFCA